jgi:hypothetical protein
MNQAMKAYHNANYDNHRQYLDDALGGQKTWRRAIKAAKERRSKGLPMIKVVWEEAR